MYYLGIDVHKRDSQIAVLDDDGEVVEEYRLENDQFDELAEAYAGSKAALGILDRTTVSCAGKRPSGGIQSIYRFGTVGLVLAVGIGSGWLSPLTFVALLTAACLLQIGIGYGIRWPASTPSWSD